MGMRVRKLMANGEQNHRLNFPDDDTEVYPEKTSSSNYIGVSYSKHTSQWFARRHRKHGKNQAIYNGSYEDEETAAHASDTLARKLMEKGEQSRKRNFPDDDTEVLAEKKATSSNYIGVSYNASKW